MYLILLHRSSLTQLREINLSDVLMEPPPLLESLVCDNESLERVTLDVSKDCFTDSILATMLKNNHNLKLVKNMQLYGGLLSTRALTKLLTLPALQKLSINLPSFPIIPSSIFGYLQCQLAKGNYQCILENIANED